MTYRRSIRSLWFQPRPFYLSGLLLAAITIHSQQTSADIYWRGDFETGDLSQWTYLLNPAGVSLSREHKAEGRLAAHITIQGKPEYLWNNDPALNRVELQYRPDAKRSMEGSDVYFGWSFMLPRLLARDRHEFGYWESAPSYRQIMRFNLSGPAISFQVNTGEGPLWKSDAVLPEQWHDVAMHIHWSTDPRKGYVSVWFDRAAVVTKAPAQTLVPNDEGVFVQLGILRDSIDTVEEIYIDSALETSSIEAILEAQQRRAEPITKEQQERIGE